MWLVGSSRSRKLASESINFARETRPSFPNRLNPWISLNTSSPVKKEGCQCIADLGVVHVWIGVLYFLEQGLVHVKYLVFLIVVAKYALWNPNESDRNLQE